MCGINGFNWADKPLINKMTSLLSYRGPDDSGVYVDSKISMGHRRLSIIDLSKQGHQPMFNEKEDIVIVYNGEIYNFHSLRELLQKKGHKFCSDSDTEVIIHGYEEYGEQISSMLEGMFAFALWDSKKKKLILSRDRIGKKPLYYSFKGGKLIFSSEIKAIMLCEVISKKINLQCLSDYLTLRYSFNGETIFSDIKKIEPGTYLVYENSSITLKRHWSIPELKASSKPDEKTVDDLISSAVQKRLVSDVPIGVFLSGGLDSSAIVSYMSRFSENINTFSVGFGDNTDETKYAKIVADRFSTNHKAILLDKDIISRLPEVVWHLDEPLADPASLPTYLLCEQVSKHVKVALSGEGGDETFGGYQTFNYINKIVLAKKFPLFMRKAAGKLLSSLSPLFKYPNKQILNLGSEILSESDIFKMHEKMFYFPFNEEDKRKLLPESISSKINLSNPALKYLASSGNLWDNSILYYFKDWLPNDLLMKVDKTSMAHGLEVRTPFLDTGLIDYFFSLDNKYKHNRMIFRKVVSKHLPNQIMQKKKQGFTLPLSNWFAKKEFLDSLSGQFKDLSQRKIFNADYYNQIVSKPLEFRNDHRLWVLLNLELWFKMYIDNTDYNKIKL